jgi:hypothetical protein
MPTRFRAALRRGAAVAALAALPGFASLATAGGTGTVHAATRPGFATPTIVDPVNLYGEPDLRQDRAHPNVWYASGPWGTGTQLSVWNRSTDGARTFRELHDHPDPLHTGGSLRLPPGGGDTEIAVDHTGKFYGADLGALTTQKAITSPDQGVTINEQPVPRVFQDPNAAGTDRQWFGLWDPPDPAAAHANSAYKGPFPVNYMVYLRAIDPVCTATYAMASVSVGCEMVASSVPSSTGDASQVGLDYGCSPSSTDTGSSNCPQWLLAGDGYVFLDQLTGKVVQAMDYADPNASSPQDQAAVEVIAPGSTGYMDPASAKRHIVATLDGAGTGALFPVIAEDSARNAYYVWVERPNDSTKPRKSSGWQVYYSWSPPGADSQWDHWSKPIRVSRGPSNTATMPWVVAGSGGNIDVAWYGTDSMTPNPEDEGMSADASWYIYMAQVTGADTGSPSISQAKAYDRPMHHGSICLSGTGCIQKQGNRNLADFFEITADAQGAAYIVFDNTANDLIQQVPVVQQPLPEGTIDHKGAELVEVVRQVSGMGINGTPIDAPSDFGVDGITSAAGDALYDPINGTNNPGLDIQGVSLTAQGDKLEATVRIADPSQMGAAAVAIGAPFVDVLVRWEYNSTLYFAAAEVNASGGTPTFFDGAAESIDLCSVSACDPHVMTYPGADIAPNTSHVTTGQVNAAAGGAPGTITIDVPRADVGGPRNGERLDSVGAYSLASLLSFDMPLPNAMAENDMVPIEVDGACCFTPILGSKGTTTSTTSTASTSSSGAGSKGAPTPPALPNTSATGAAGGGAVAGAAGAVLGFGVMLGRRHRRRRSLSSTR